MKHSVSFIQLLEPMFMSATNLGQKINCAQRGIRIYWEDSNNTFGAYFKGRFAGIGAGNVCSFDLENIPTDAIEFFKISAEKTAVAEIALVAKKRGRPFTKVSPPVDAPVLQPPSDPNDTEASARYRESVRQASANANIATHDLTESAITDSRLNAMGIKPNRTNAQVGNAGDVAKQVNGKSAPKYMTHGDLAKKIAAESK